MGRATAFLAWAFTALAHCQPAIQPLPKDPPSAVEKHALLDRVRAKALDYSRGLPNFICTQQTKRYTGKLPKGKDLPSWKLADTLTLQLSFFDQKENYRLIMVNGKRTEKSLDEIHGGVLKGDFGSALKGVFDPRSRAAFTWDHWGMWNGRLVAAVSHYIDLRHAAFSTTVTRYGGRDRIDWASEGLVIFDAESLDVLRLTVNSTEVPPGSRAGEVHMVLNYGRQMVGEKEYLLPVSSEHVAGFPDGRLSRGVATFSGYRKFETESGIRFDAGDQPSNPPAPR